MDHIFSGATGTVSFTHGYDRSARVTSVVVSPAGWIWQAPGGSNTESYGTANALDQYPNVAGQTLTWDTRGNLSALGALSFGHDSANRLLSASRSTGQTFSATYTYDGIDRRVARAGSGTGVTAVRFVHAGDEEIAEWHPTTNTVLRRYVPGPAIDQPVAYVEHVGGTQLFYYHQDRLGNIIATANASGGLADRYVYTPYGVEHPLVATGQPLRYNARRFDPESALYHYRARFYSPALGRFLQTDPVGYEADLNLYAYVGNDPLNRVDPTGRDPLDWLREIIAVGNGNRVQEAQQRYANGEGSSSEIQSAQLNQSAVRHGTVHLATGTIGIALAGAGSPAAEAAPAAPNVLRAWILALTGRAAATRGATGGIVTRAGEEAVGFSTHAARTAGEVRAPMHPRVQAALDSAPDAVRALPRHGKCCEIDMANRVLNAGADTEGAVSVAVDRSGKIIPPCPSCRHVNSALGIRQVGGQ